ncbi:capsule biosynthesis protein [Sphingomonas glaciei]|uniref:Capsule biosynthesis protein n=1 Tax=Sphingomonas glaciei TaxID=2938948 RepID=A0ABY5MVT0_9SPHN|nr:capsule biosynthesis protein [Sphingomonas glaciei]UUR08091.1 capsule biosynthesis protein [Sphingomonas glaciei]
MNANNLDHEALTEVIRQSQRRSWFYRHRFMGLFVGLPTLLAIVYYAFIATPVYVSYSSFVIKSPNQRPTQSLSLANIVQTTGFGMGSEQTKEILQYLRSRNALKDLQAKLNVRDLYAERGADFLSRFPKPFRGTTFEDLFRYYNSRVSADIDSESNMAVLQVEAFTPQDALAINARLLDLSEGLVNRLNQRAENRAISEAERRLLQAEERVRNARVSLSAFRNQSNIIDPERQAQGVLEISNRLVTEQAALQAQLDLMVQVAPLNPAIPALRERIAAVGTAIDKQNSRAVGSPRAISSKLATFEKLQVEQEFATQMLTAANTSLEQARTESQKQQYYLERVVEPNRPDDPALPNGWRQVLTILGASLCLYFIGWMLIVGILEHSPED